MAGADRGDSSDYSGNLYFHKTGGDSHRGSDGIRIGGAVYRYCGYYILY